MDAETRRLLKLYKEADAYDTRVFRGESAAVVGRGTGVMLNTQGGTLSKEAPITAPVNWHQNLPVLRKRTPAERAESLANRFWQAVKDGDPAQTEMVLRMLYKDSWVAGKPISYDEVKQVAVELLRQAAAKAGAPH